MYVFRRRTWLAGLIGGSTVGLAMLAACLPDLNPIAPIEAGTSPDADTTPFTGCGDGFIETLDDGGEGAEGCDPGDASVVGCENCRFVCAGAIDTAGHCYFVAGDAYGFVEATNQCASQNAHLVTISSAREASFVAGLLAGADAGDVPHWVGLFVDNSVGASAGSPYAASDNREPGWPGSPNPCTGCFAIGADTKNAFAPLTDAEVAGGCLVADRDAGWLQVACPSGQRSFKTVCEREPVGQRIQFCNGPYCATIAVTAGRKRYVISLDPATADEAARACASNYSGTLVTFESREEREQLVQEIRKQLTEPMTFWIGLSLSNDNQWVWEDGLGDDGGARPFQWGDQQPSDASTSGRRAFLSLPEDLENALNPLSRRRFDTQLAYSDDGQGADARRPYICERF